VRYYQKLLLRNPIDIDSGSSTESYSVGCATLPRGTRLPQTTIETREVPNLFCCSCRKGSDFDVSVFNVAQVFRPEAFTPS
jgi:hypothetical protein